MAGSVTIQGLLTGTTSGTQYVGPLTIPANSSGQYESVPYSLSSGANTIAVPSWAAFALIIPSTSNSQTLTLKGVTGDTGTALSLTNPNLLTFPTSPPASFVITAGGATTATVVFS